MTFELYQSFIDAVSKDQLIFLCPREKVYFGTNIFCRIESNDEQERVSRVRDVVSRLPGPNRLMLRMLMDHLVRVAANSEVNMMGVQNLAVCFGPTLMRVKEEETAGGAGQAAPDSVASMASIVNIKFGNMVVAILVQHWSEVLHDFVPCDRKRVQPGTLVHVPGEVGHVMKTILC